MAADLPENYEGHPAFQFILDVPTDWKQTMVLNAEIGKYITTVRQDRESDDWYLGSITNDDPRTLTIEMSFLDKDKEYVATIYKDPADGGWKTRPEEILIDNMIFNNGDSYDIVLPSGGGQAIKFSPKG
jgi:alpha-glucosidase